MDPDVFQQIRTACQAVAEAAILVQIDYGQIQLYAASLPRSQIQHPQLDPRHHYLGHAEETVAYILILDTLNFGSGYFPHLHKRPGLSGYFTVASSLKDYFETQGPPTAEVLSQITAEDCFKIFSQDSVCDRHEPDQGPRSELMQLFATALNQLGQYLLSRFDGQFTALVEAAGTSTERLVLLLAEMPYFRDIARYDALEVPFYKRAQLTAADLSLAFHNQGYGWFKDLHRLTLFADNLVPHVLRMDKVLHYENSLAAAINAGNLIPAGSRAEVEIRAAAVHAVELLVAELQRQGQPVSAQALDYFLWNRGQQPVYKAHPRHRTRTVFY